MIFSRKSAQKLGAATFICALSLTACNSGGPTYITSNAQASPQISVSATGQVSQAPDRARVSAGVISQGENANDAMRANAELMSRAFEQLRSAGIEDRHIQTSQLSLKPRYNYQDRRSPKIDGYDVRNTITATATDIDRIGPMLDALVKAGVNNINNVSFTISEPESAKAQAREKAVKAAKAKAEAMAKAAGVSLGRLTAMSENSSPAPRPQPVSYARSQAIETVQTPISAGEQNLSVTVHLTYEIKG